MDKERLLKVMRCLIDTTDRTTSLANVYNDGWDGECSDGVYGFPTGRDAAREYQESVTWSEVRAAYTALCYDLADEKFLAAHPHK